MVLKRKTGEVIMNIIMLKMLKVFANHIVRTLRVKNIICDGNAGASLTMIWDFFSVEKIIALGWQS